MEHLQGKLGDNIVVHTVVHDNQCSNSRRKPEQTLLRETIRLDLAVLERPHCLLFLPIAAVKWRKIEI